MNRKEYIAPQVIVLHSAVTALNDTSNHIIGNRPDVTPSSEETEIVRGKSNRGVWDDEEERDSY